MAVIRLCISTLFAYPGKLGRREKTELTMRRTASISRALSLSLSRSRRLHLSCGVYKNKIQQNIDEGAQLFLKARTPLFAH